MSRHAAALAELRAWTPPDPSQAALRDEYVALLETRPDALERGCHPAHITASTIILNAAATHTLLVHHAKIDLWAQPGGHCEDDDPSLPATALREGREETGLTDLELVPGPLLLSRHSAPCAAGRIHYDVQYLAIAASLSTPTVSDESLDVRWFPVSALPDQVADGVPENLRTALTAAAGAPSR